MVIKEEKLAGILCKCMPWGATCSNANVALFLLETFHGCHPMPGKARLLFFVRLNPVAFSRSNSLVTIPGHSSWSSLERLGIFPPCSLCLLYRDCHHLCCIYPFTNNLCHLIICSSRSEIISLYFPLRHPIESQTTWHMGIHQCLLEEW